MKSILIGHCERIFSLTTDIANAVAEPMYTKWSLAQAERNFGDVVLDIVKAREALLHKLEHGSLDGFRCSLSENSNKLHTMKALFETSNSIVTILETKELSDNHYSLLISLLEWESLQHGELVALVSTHQGVFPQTWVEAYKLG